MKVLEELCRTGRRLYERGYAYGGTGNLSVRQEDEIWITPTGRSLAGLSPDQLARTNLQGEPRNENRPSKELPLHLAVYRRRGEAVGAIVHLHSVYCVALSCLEDLDPERPLPALTPYFFMRLAPLAVVPYHRPGSLELAGAVASAAEGHECLLLRNHGQVCVGSSLGEAASRAEEFEETARLHFILRRERVRELTAEDLREIQRAFPRKA